MSVVGVDEYLAAELFEAVGKNDVGTLKRMFDENGLNIEIQNGKEGETPLMRALTTNAFESASFLLSRNANINATNFLNQSVLIVLCLYGSMESIVFALNNGADVHSKDFFGMNALMNVVGSNRSDSYEIIELLLNSGVDVNEKDKKGQNVVMKTIRNEKDKLKIFDLLVAYGAEVHAHDNYGWSVLIHSCERNETAIANRLMDLGVNVNLSTNVGNSAFMYACRNRNVELMKRLHDAKCDVHVVNNHGENAFIKLCVGQQGDIRKPFELLLSWDIDVFVGCEKGSSGIFLYMRNNKPENLNTDFIELFIECVGVENLESYFHSKDKSGLLNYLATDNQDKLNIWRKCEKACSKRSEIRTQLQFIPQNDESAQMEKCFER